MVQPKILLFTLILVATVNSYHSYDIVSSLHMVINWNWPILINSLDILVINGKYIFIYLWIYHIFIYLDIIWKLQKWYKEFMNTLHRYFDILWHLLYPFVSFSLFPSVYLCIIFSLNSFRVPCRSDVPLLLFQCIFSKSKEFSYIIIVQLLKSGNWH